MRIIKFVQLKYSFWKNTRLFNKLFLIYTKQRVSAIDASQEANLAFQYLTGLGDYVEWYSKVMLNLSALEGSFWGKSRLQKDKLQE